MILINDLICKSPVELNWSLARVMRRMQSNSILSVNHATIQLIVTKKTLKVSRSETMYIYSLNFISFVCLLFFCLTYICWIVFIFVIFCLTYIVKLYSFFTFLFTWALFLKKTSIISVFVLQYNIYRGSSRPNDLPIHTVNQLLLAYDKLLRISGYFLRQTSPCCMVVITKQVWIRLCREPVYWKLTAKLSHRK